VTTKLKSLELVLVRNQLKTGKIGKLKKVSLKKRLQLSLMI
jgi:hypothetical protein